MRGWVGVGDCGPEKNPEHYLPLESQAVLTERAGTESIAAGL